MISDRTRQQTPSDFPFLKGGGEMGELMRTYNWSGTSIGSPDTWPQNLRIAISILLNSKFPMFIFWTDDLIQFYNDAYRPSLGIDGKHPHALGKSGYDTWAEIWDTIQPLIRKVMINGESVWFEDQFLPIYRNGRMENVYWTYSYSPLNDEVGIPQGVFVTCYESTEKVKAYDQLRESKEMYQFAIEASELGTWDLNLGSQNLTINQRLQKWLGIENEKLDFEQAARLIDASDFEKVKGAIKVLSNDDKALYDIEYSLINQVNAKKRTVRVRGKVFFNSEGRPGRLNGTVQDITLEKEARALLVESESHIRNLFNQAPVAIAIFKGQDFVIELANDQVLEYWQKTYQEVIGQSVFKVLPLADSNQNETLLRHVLATGEQYRGKEREVSVVRNNQTEKVYVNFVYEPYFKTDGIISGVILIANDVTEQVNSRKQIEESEQRYHQLVEQATVATAIYLGPEMRVKIANEAMLKLWGKPDDVIGMKLAEVLPELEGQPFLKLLDKVYASGETYWSKQDRVQLNIDGKMQTGYFNFTYKALRDLDGNIYGVLNMAIEVTEMVIAKRLLEESERNLKNMILQAPVAMCALYGTQHVVEVANEAMFELWGKKPQEMLHKPIFEGLPEAKNQGLEQILADVFKTGNRFTANELPVYLPRSGNVELTYLNFIYEAVKNKSGDIDRILAIANDVTAQVISRKETEEREKEFRLMADSMPQIVYVADARGIINYYNKQWHNYTGFTDEEGIQELETVMHPKDVEAYQGLWQASILSGEEFEMELRLSGAGVKASYSWFLCRATPVKDDQGNVFKWFGTCTDIHDQKKQQQQKDEFISVASHELKTPLTTLKASLQLINRLVQTEITSERLKELVEKSNYNLKKLIILVDDLLSSTKIEQGQLILNESVFTVAQLIDECCDHVRLEGTHEIVTSGDLNLQVFADHQKIDQVMVNLVNNAVKYAPKSAKILIHIGKENDMVKVTVQDFGIGIPAEKLPHLFDRFYRVDNSGVQYSGLGLGLYISAEIVKKHGGILTAESTIGHGSKFWFTLPASV